MLAELLVNGHVTVPIPSDFHEERPESPDILATSVQWMGAPETNTFFVSFLHHGVVYVALLTEFHYTASQYFW